MSTKAIRPRSRSTGISASHWARSRSTPVGLWQQACSSTTLPAGRPPTVASISSKRRPPLASS
ncbi:Uncharacterised protein [Bordetella pertussis]|nr:Uncharacterised protein [Bordetella pertussis]CFW32079.1 Uncharacterised protein [Bordetella pertussis]